MKKYLLLLCVPLLMGTVWNGANELSPADGDQASTLGDSDRTIKVDNRVRNQAEHHFGSGFGIGTEDNGLHQTGSARCFLQSAAPTALSNSSGDYDNATDNPLNVTDLNDGASGTGAAAASDDVGHGRCWIDLDDGKMYVYTGVTGNNNGGWTPVAGAGTGTHSLVYNGSFDAMDGDGITTDAVPAGWAVSAGPESPTFAYASSTDVDWGVGTMVTLTNSGATDEGMQYELDGLAANSTYLVLARALDDGTAVCTLGVTGDDTPDFAALTGGVIVTAGGAAWTTLIGTFTTDAIVDNDVIVDLETTGADLLLCSYSNVNVYKIDGPEVSQGGGPMFTATSNASNTITGAYADVQAGFSVAVTPPRQGCVVEFYASVIIDINAANTANCGVEEDDGSAEVKGEQSFEVNTKEEHSFNLMGANINPAPGTTITYTPQCKVNGAGSSDYICDEADIDCDLFVKMTCGGN